MQVDMHISRAEEAAFGIKIEHTIKSRADFDLLHSDDLMMEAPDVGLEPEDTCEKIVGKRARTDTQSTITPPSKKYHIHY